jgi:hypothetical protein
MGPDPLECMGEVGWIAVAPCPLDIRQSLAQQFDAVLRLFEQTPVGDQSGVPQRLCGSQLAGQIRLLATALAAEPAGTARAGA